MAYRKKAYTLKEEIREEGTRYSIGFKDGQGDYHELEVSPVFYAEFRRLELNNRKLENWDWRHREFSEVWEETLNRRTLRLPKNMNEQLIDKERDALLYRLIDELPETQRRRFLLYYEYDFNYYQIGAMEHCNASAARNSVVIAREKIKAQMKKYLAA
ncbi:MAG: sigma factor-like helix-turn-helix DNA-binding protein [Eubacteriales bacterium]|nr:sigma factor-like helix-turn-helix DNA-binding protein [Eubacteriales bacterium]